MFQTLRTHTRGLARQPSLPLLAVTILAVGIGLTTAMFSIVHGIVLRGLPIENAEELVHLEARHLESGERRQLNRHQARDWIDGQSTFRELHGFRSEAVHLAGEGPAERVEGARITPGGFSHLGIAPLLGRDFSRDDVAPDAAPVAIIAHGLWNRRFGQAPTVLGSVQRIDGQSTTIVGVMPEGFRFPSRQEIWLPLALEPDSRGRTEDPAVIHLFGRLDDGVSQAKAAADLGVVTESLSTTYPESDAGLGPVVEPYGNYFLEQSDVDLAWTSLGAVVLVLLIACFNVAGLMLSRASRQTHENAVRTALGASRWRLSRGALIDAGILAAIGSVAGIGIASVLVSSFNRAVADQEWPFWFDVRLDGPSLVFVLVCAACVTLIAGAAPAWSSARTDVTGILRNGARSTGRSRFRTGLVVTEIVLSCVLLAGAGLMVRTLINLSQLDYAFTPSEIFAGRIDLDESRYPDRREVLEGWSAIAREVARAPGVTYAGIADSLPAAEWAPRRDYLLEGTANPDSGGQQTVRRIRASPQLFAALGIEPLAGRSIETFDREETHRIAVVNRSFAQRHGTPASIVGQRLRFPQRKDTEEIWWEIVGVVPDLNAGGPKDDGPEAIYLPLSQSPIRSAVLVVGVRGEIEAAANSIRAAVANVDPDLPIYFSGSLDHQISQQLFFYRLVGSLFGLMALVSLVLAATGLFGLISFDVSQRHREIGVKMAIGASPRDVLLMVVRGGVGKVLLGLALAAIPAWFAADFLQHLLYGLRGMDAVTAIMVASMLLVTGVGAAFWPAFRASRIDPNRSIRSH